MKKQLEELGHRVFVPKFPTPEGESLTSWLEVLRDYEKYIDENTIIIGHSKGGLFLLRVLERLEKPIEAAFFISTPIGIRPILYFDADSMFSGFNFNWDKIKIHAKYYSVYHSDNDPYVDLENGNQLAKKLGVALNFIPEAGHLNAESGYTTFEALLEEIKTKL
jgi:predicted alpha/beta hydrolase family esterase